MDKDNCIGFSIAFGVISFLFWLIFLFNEFSVTKLVVCFSVAFIASIISLFTATFAIFDFDDFVKWFNGKSGRNK